MDGLKDRKSRRKKIKKKVPIINNDNEVEVEDLDAIPEIVPINGGGNRRNPDLTAGRYFQQH